MTILAAGSMPAARETARTPAMADKPPATTAHVTFSATSSDGSACETNGFRCDPPEPGWSTGLGQTVLATVIVTSCLREAPLRARPEPT